MSTVYRVIAGGTHVQAVQLVKSSGNGWKNYRILPPDPLAYHTFNTREWFPCPTPMGAVLCTIGQVANRMRIASICLSDANLTRERARQIRREVDADAVEMLALLTLAQMFSAQAGLMMTTEKKEAP